MFFFTIFKFHTFTQSLLSGEHKRRKKKNLFPTTYITKRALRRLRKAIFTIVQIRKAGDFIMNGVTAETSPKSAANKCFHCRRCITGKQAPALERNPSGTAVVRRALGGLRESHCTSEWHLGIKTCVQQWWSRSPSFEVGKPPGVFCS